MAKVLMVPRPQVVMGSVKRPIMDHYARTIGGAGTGAKRNGAKKSSQAAQTMEE